MWKWLFNKVIKVREKVAVDLGDGDVEKPFIEHLEDLRTMIVRMAITLCVFMIGTFFFAVDLIHLLMYPLTKAGLADKVKLIGLGPTDYFMTEVNVSMYAGIILSFPFLLWFLLQFILPGLKTTEKKVLFPALGIGVGLFLTGVVFSFMFVLPGTLTFFFACGDDINGALKPGETYPWSIVAYTKFVTQFVMVFGACFETPVLVMALVKLEILTYKVMKTTRSYAIVGIAILAAIVTPTQDALTLLLLIVPMYSLYEICIWLAWWLEKKDREANPEYYKGLDEDEKAMEAEVQDWDNENYNPWNDDSDDDEDLKPKPKPSPDSGGSPAAAEPSTEPEKTPSEAAPASPVTESSAEKPAEEHKEKTLEDYAREAESFTGNPPDEHSSSSDKPGDKPADEKPKQ